MSLCMFSSQQPQERLQEEWMREKRELERKMAELQTALQVERRVRKADVREIYKVISSTKKKYSIFFFPLL